jgi:hypothetical protein
MKSLQPIYMIQRGDARLNEYRPVFDQLDDNEIHTLNIEVSPIDVEECATGGVQEMLMCLQHYPHLVSKMLFSVNFKFREGDNDENVIADEVWKNDPKYYKWFQEMMGTPFVLFFIADEDARFYALAADILEAGDVELEFDQEDGRTCVTFTREQTTKLEARLLKASCALLMFCHGSGFNPKIYIEGVMALMNASFKYDDVMEAYQAQLESYFSLQLKGKDAA